MEGEGGQERGTRALSFTAGETQWGSAGGPVRLSLIPVPRGVLSRRILVS